MTEPGKTRLHGVQMTQGSVVIFFPMRPNIYVLKVYPYVLIPKQILFITQPSVNYCLNSVIMTQGIS